MRQHSRQPKVGRYARAALKPKRIYKAIGISLYDDELAWIEEVTHALQSSGHRRNRSFALQALIRRSRKELEGKSKQEIVRYFMTRHGKKCLLVDLDATNSAVMVALEPWKSLSAPHVSF